MVYNCITTMNHQPTDAVSQLPASLAASLGLAFFRCSMIFPTWTNSLGPHLRETAGRLRQLASTRFFKLLN